MFCPECGAQLPENAVFCGNCGTRIKEAPDTQTQAWSVNDRNMNTAGSAPERFDKSERKRVPIIPIIAGAAAVVVLIAVYLIISKGKSVSDNKASVETAKPSTYFQSEEKVFPQIPEKPEKEPETPVNDAAVVPDSTTPEAPEVTETVEPPETPEAPEAPEAPQIPEEPEAPKAPEKPETPEVPENTAVDMAAIAKKLSTPDYALATDFEWFLDYELLGGEYQGKLVSDRNLTKVITADTQELLNGGWKAYMYFTDGSTKNIDWERYFHADIQTVGNDFSMTMSWKYMFEGSSGRTIEETGTDPFKGTWNADGTVSALADFAKVTFDTFLISQDSTAEYALGTFYWISGEQNRIALVRVNKA